MRVTSIFSEAWRNLLSGTSRSGALAIVLVTLAAGLAGWESVTVAAIRDDVVTYQAGGGSVVVLEAGAGVDGEACDNLSRRQPGITASGAWRASATAQQPTALPGSVIRDLEVTPGLRELLGLPMGGVAVSDVLADTLGVRAGSPLAFAAGVVTIDGVFPYPTDGRDPTLENAFLFTAPATGAFDECWARVWPSNDAVETLLFSTLRSDATDDARLGRLNPRLADSFDAHERYLERQSRYAALIAAVGGVAIGVVGSRVRRVEIAVARHLGVTPADSVVQICVEVLAWAVPATVIGAAVALWLPALTGSTTGDPLVGDIWWQAARPAVTALAGVLLGSIAGTVTVRERSLYHYVRSRT